jgi:vacuolar-type H+-ATPase subunit I/STV1
MSQIKTRTYLLNLENYSPADLVKDTFYRGIEVEYLNPHELGEPWSHVYTHGSEETETSRTLEQVDSILARTAPKSLFSALLDERIPTSPDDLGTMEKNQEDWSMIASDIDLYFEIKDQLDSLKDYAAKYRQEVVYFGRQMSNLGPQFRTYVETILRELEEKEISIPQTVTLPTLSVDQIDQYQGVRLDKEFVELFNDFLKEFNLDDTISLAKDSILALEKQKSNLRSALSEYLKNETINHNTRVKLSHLHTLLETQQTTAVVESKIFSLEKESPARFLFVNINPTQIKKFQSLVSENQLAAEETVWKDEIVEWNNPENLRPFQAIAQSVGTIDDQEADPTGILSIFFMVFFAFCLADAVYGIIISVITGYFLFFRNLKSGFKNIFGLFFFSGLVTTIYGVLTNSWAGDFFVSDIYQATIGLDFVNDFLANFQVVQVLITDGESAQAAELLPVNNAIGDLNPIILMMLIALFLGLLNSLSAYLLRIISAVKSRDYGIALATGTWIVFLSSLAFVITTQAFAQSLSDIALAVFGIAFLAILFFNEATNIVGKILAALFGKYGLYGLVQLAADLVSYTRIIAIGLTGGVIASIVNLMAFMLYQAGGPIFGILLGIIVLIGGHIFNFVLSVFGAYINPLRLTYVEFMPKFYDGRGRQWKPLKPEFKYTRVA